MTYLEIDSAILAISQQMCNECKARLDAISKENRTERKAVQLEYAMYNFCSDILNDRKDNILRRQRFLEKVMYMTPELASAYQALDDERKLCFVAALHAQPFIQDQWVNKKEAELAAATASGDTKNVFELTIQLGAVKNMFAAWEQWRIENNIFPHMFEGDCA